MTTVAAALLAALDVIAEAKSDETDSFLMGVLAGVEDAIEAAQLDVIAWAGQRA
ncbi:MAG TPA: hypothetical protein VK504_13810 [Vicinamibacterales bacterium]|nr:hypothetical protein [Vicinamibacterales bacterium]